MRTICSDKRSEGGTAISIFMEMKTNKKNLLGWIEKKHDLYIAIDYLEVIS